MDIFSEFNKALMPGNRVIRVNGWEQAEKYPIPRDCEVIMLDCDPDSDYIYMKKTDINGAPTFARYKIKEEPIPKFDPEKYVTVDNFNELRKEMLNEFNSLKQSLPGTAQTRESKSNSFNK